MSAGRRFRVALCGYYGFGNLGDELLASALLDALEKSGVSRNEILLLSGSPGDTARVHGVHAVFRWSVPKVFAALRMSETLLLGGGGLFQDVTSRRSSLYYWGIVRLALLAGAVPWCAGQSLGPFRTRCGEAFARSAMKACAVRGVRDCSAMKRLSGWGLDAVLTSDPVFSLECPADVLLSEDELIVNIRPWPGALPRRTAEESTRLAGQRNLEITGFALAPEDVGEMERLRQEGVFPAKQIVLLSGENWRSEVERVFSRAAGVVSMRFHASVLALLCGRALTTVAYDPKVQALSSQERIPCWDGSGLLPEPRLPENRGDVSGERIVFQEKFSAMWSAVMRLLEKKE